MMLSSQKSLLLLLHFRCTAPWKCCFLERWKGSDFYARLQFRAINGIRTLNSIKRLWWYLFSIFMFPWRWNPVMWYIPYAFPLSPNPGVRMSSVQAECFFIWKPNCHGICWEGILPVVITFPVAHPSQYPVDSVQHCVVCWSLNPLKAAGFCSCGNPVH